MDVTSRVTLITGLITALIALVGYLITQHAKRRDRRSQLYAEALEVLAEYQELPYLIRRRMDETAATRSVLTTRISAVHAKLQYYGPLLRLVRQQPFGV